MTSTTCANAVLLNISCSRFVSHTFTIKLNIDAKHSITLLEIYVEHNIQHIYWVLTNPYDSVYQHLTNWRDICLLAVYFKCFHRRGTIFHLAGRAAKLSFWHKKVICFSCWYLHIILQTRRVHMIGDLAPVPLSIFRSNSKFDENKECSSFKYTRPITTIFCTRHDSDTVVTCAKYRCDRPRIFYTRVFWIFIEFRIRSKYA